MRHCGPQPQERPALFLQIVKKAPFPDRKGGRIEGGRRRFDYRSSVPSRRPADGPGLPAENPEYTCKYWIMAALGSHCPDEVRVYGNPENAGRRHASARSRPSRGRVQLFLGRIPDPAGACRFDRCGSGPAGVQGRRRVGRLRALGRPIASIRRAGRSVTSARSFSSALGAAPSVRRPIPGARP